MGGGKLATRVRRLNGSQGTRANGIGELGDQWLIPGGMMAGERVGCD